LRFQFGGLEVLFGGSAYQSPLGHGTVNNVE